MMASERHARPGNPLASRSRAVLAFHARWRHFPDGDADRARLLDNERTPGVLLEARFPAFASSKEPVFVDARNAREAYTRAWIDGDKELDARDATVATFSTSIYCGSIVESERGDVPAFPDSGLSCIATTYQPCMKHPETIEIHHTGLENITRIPACMSKYTNLKVLDLPIKAVRRIENLDKNTNLEYIWLRRTAVSKIEGLDTLVNLKVLDLSNTNVSKIEGLGALVKLEELNLHDNQIKKIEGLDKLVNLEELNLDNNQIKKIEGLDKLVKLRCLNLDGNKIPPAQCRAFHLTNPRIDVYF